MSDGKLYRYASTQDPSQSSDATVSCAPIRIVHISDTHDLQDKLLKDGLIPDGDILIHSGDFQQLPSTLCPPKINFEEELADMDEFFGRLPHRHKIIIGGNHERLLENKDPTVVNSLLKNCTYLQDSSINVCGLKIYGSPWTIWRWYSFAKAFTQFRSRLSEVWKSVPEDVDVMVTHSPPMGILDLERVPHGYRTLWRGKAWRCTHCAMNHDGNEEHFGCDGLRRYVFGIRPLAHLFGHAHSPAGLLTLDGIIFSNAATKSKKLANVIDIYKTI